MISKQWLGRCISRGSPCGVLEIRNSRSYSTVYYSVYSYSVYVYISRGLPRSAIPFISRISRGLPRSIPYISRVSRGLPRSAIPTFLQTRRGCRGCAGRSSPPVHRKRGSAIAKRPKRRPATTGTRLGCWTCAGRASPLRGWTAWPSASAAWYGTRRRWSCGCEAAWRPQPTRARRRDSG